MTSDERSYLIAVAHDDYTIPGGFRDAASPLWIRILSGLGHKVREVRITSLDDAADVATCDGFMWRWAHFGGMARIAKRLIPALEMHSNLTCFPNWDTCWHYDDKVAQAYIFLALGIPHIPTRVFFDLERAKEFLSQAEFPLVLKLSTGASSSNVMLVQTCTEACLAVDRLFRERITQLFPGFPEGRNPYDEIRDFGREAQSGYAIFQTFLPGNTEDIRVTVVGQTAYGFTRQNRDNDFRASGSGKINYDPARIPIEAVRLAFDAARKLRMQSAAFDILRDGETLVINEVSYTYVMGALEGCPGQWLLKDDGEIIWRQGHRQIEYDQVSVFLADLEHSTVSFVNTQTVLQPGVARLR